MAKVACAESAVGRACALLQRNVWVFNALSVVCELSELVIHVSRAEVELLNLTVLGAGLAQPNLAFALIDGSRENPVAFRTDASRFANLLSLGPLYLNSLQI